MKLLCIIIGIFLAGLLTAQAQIINNEDNNSGDSLQSPPIMDVKPSEFRISENESGFITRKVKVLNRGGSPLKIISVTGSCGCSKASVQSGVIHPLTVGKIILYINLDGLYDDNRIVEYVIESNASNSPVSVKVIFDESIIKKNKKNKK